MTAAMAKVARYELSNVARSRWLLAYALFFLVTTDALLRFGGDGSRALLSLVSVVLFVIPLVGLVFGTTYLYDAREFTELLLAQPVGRGRLFAGLFAGLALPLSAAFALGVGLPFAWHGVAGASQLADEPPDECPTMSACAATPPAVIPIVSDVLAVLPSAQELFRGHGLIPDQADPAPPFHPPSA